MYQAFQYRIKPTVEQEAALAVQFGHARFVYNWALQQRIQVYQQTKKSLSFSQLCKLLTQLKQQPDYLWLNDAYSQCLQQKLKDLGRAFTHFFEGHARFPKPKKKHDRQSIRFPQGFHIKGEQLYLPKLGGLALILHRPLQGTPKSVTVSKTKSGHYFVSILCEVEASPSLPSTSQRPAVGLDLGLTHFLTTSQGEQVENPRWLRRSERKLAKLQRKLQRKKKGSKNREKARLQLAKQAEGVSHQRRDFQHKLSKRLVREHSLLVFEDLNVRGMVKNRRLAKSIHDAAWSQFVRFCEYKGAWYGCDVVKVGRFFASSKLCSCCGWKHESLRLKDRAWTCGGCGTHHDRDKNAAKNLLHQALSSLGLEPTDLMSVETA